MPNIIGVRVHLNTDSRPTVLHEQGQTFFLREDCALSVLDESGAVISLYAPESWFWVELVHAEPESIEDIAVVGRITLGAPAGPYITVDGNGTTMHGALSPAERIAAAEQAYADARKAQLQAHMDAAHAVMDAEIALDDLKRELGEAA